MTAVGERVGRFRILGVLGRGGMGEVYVGFDEMLQRRVALKTIRSDRRLDESARNRFLREARLLSQLDHPAICRIYDYVEGDECDLLALELIEGKTLRAVIAEGLEFREKVRIATEVARALGAAHRIGIIHRDLKPDNIMLTNDGQVKVLDFGMARIAGDGPETTVLFPVDWSETPPDDADESGDTLIRSGEQPGVPLPLIPNSDTRAGDAVGTPAYMSPEQARAENVTTASDMFSFGLVLQTLFTGRPAYDEDLPLAQLMRRAGRGEWLPVTGVDRDVAALINSLKAVAPSDRPTANSVIRTLERIANRRQRILRRVAVAAAVLAIMIVTVKYIADVRHERNVAMQARADAERRRGQAEELIGFMVGDLRDKLTPVGRLDILDDVGEKALAYFRSLRPEEISPAELRRNAKTLSQIGEVRMSQGNLAAAQKVLQASMVLAQSAADRDPADGENQLQLGASYFWMGSLLRQQGDLEGALENYTTYLTLSEKLAARDPKNSDYRLEVSYGHSNVGSVLEQLGQPEKALAHYQEAVKIKEQRLNTAPNRADWQADMALTVNKVGVVLRSLGRFDEAEATLQHENRLLESALGAKPENAQWQQRLGANLWFLGNIAEVRGDENTAMQFYERERDLEKKLVQRDPANAGWQRTLAVTQTGIARILADKGKTQEAQVLLKGAAGQLEPLLKKDPKRVLWRRDLAVIYQMLAEIDVERHNIALAKSEIDAATAALAPAPLSENETRSRAMSIALTRGLVARAAGSEVEAQREWSNTAEALRNSAQSEKISITDLDTLARALLYLGRVEEAAPIVERLSKLGYHRHALAVLAEERRLQQSATSATAQKER